MNKFLWFLGGCATGLLAAAALSVLDEESCGSSSSCVNDDDVEMENDEATEEEAPLFPEKHFKAASEIFAKASSQCCDNNDSSPDAQTT